MSCGGPPAALAAATLTGGYTWHQHSVSHSCSDPFALNLQAVPGDGNPNAPAAARRQLHALVRPLRSQAIAHALCYRCRPRSSELAGVH
jgi:hypothetical protein